ncbi:hypothetical protein K0M31_003593 [Melipona bicolor]|uniref:alkaline phosphatase n=1 Tax=Melipona bicolor TaxID=60889 RepID=A0AA40KPQ2_9HYME|nr:hypothetical protein K0M31_003593 [Melipona bicolor]
MANFPGERPETIDSIKIGVRLASVRRLLRREKFLLAEREVWYEAATRAIVARIRASAASSSVSGTTPPGGVARGVVLFVGDGMGMSTLTAARILSGQRHGNTGEEAQLAWDSFPAVALARNAESAEEMFLPGEALPPSPSSQAVRGRTFLIRDLLIT